MVKLCGDRTRRMPQSGCRAGPGWPGEAFMTECKCWQSPPRLHPRRPLRNVRSRRPPRRWSSRCDAISIMCAFAKNSRSEHRTGGTHFTGSSKLSELPLCSAHFQIKPTSAFACAQKIELNRGGSLFHRNCAPLKFHFFRFPRTAFR